MLLFSPRWLFLMPGAVTMVLGLVVMAVVIPGPLFVGKVGFDINTLLFAAAAVLVGLQAVCFAVFSKVFAIGEGLMPEDPKLNRLFRYLTLETGLMVGMLTVMAGLAGSALALGYWRQHSFGDLDPRTVMRIVIPGAMAIVAGFQVISASFFLSVLGMRSRKRRGPGQAS
jgi:hypothetical protein